MFMFVSRSIIGPTTTLNRYRQINSSQCTAPPQQLNLKVILPHSFRVCTPRELESRQGYHILREPFDKSHAANKHTTTPTETYTSHMHTTNTRTPAAERNHTTGAVLAAEHPISTFGT